MSTFIKGIACISPQKIIDNKLGINDITQHHEKYLTCIEPVYKDFINPVALRRMSRIIKMGVTAAQLCLKDAEMEKPDAIITATALGCMEDTENFLNNIVINEEKLLNPTSFIQSTHNTLGAQIALILKSHHYNVTHVHRGNAFESALLDGMLLLKSNEAENALVGAADEIIPAYFKITDRLNLWKKEKTNHLLLKESLTRGSIAGEGTAFFLLTSNHHPANYAEIKALDFFFKPKDFITTEKRIAAFLSENNITTGDIDLVILGINGDVEQDQIYRYLSNGFFSDLPQSYYKHLCGEYHTSSAFALWLAAVVLKNKQLPEIIKYNSLKNKNIKNVLIYNHYLNINHSLILLSECQD